MTIITPLSVVKGQYFGWDSGRPKKQTIFIFGASWTKDDDISGMNKQ